MSCGDGKVDPLEDCDFGENFNKFESECCDIFSCRWEPICDRRNMTDDLDLGLEESDIEEKTTRSYFDEDKLFPWMVGAGTFLCIIILLLSICLIWCHYNQRKLAKDVQILNTKYETILVEKETIDARINQAHLGSFQKLVDSRGNSNMAINIQNFVWDNHHERQSSHDVVPLKDVKEWVAAKELQLDSEEYFNKTAPPKMITDNTQSADGPPLPPKQLNSHGKQNNI